MLRNSSFCRFSGVFVNMGLTFQKADAQADLDWWSHNHGMGMPQNWPMFEVHKHSVYLHYKIPKVSLDFIHS